MSSFHHLGFQASSPCRSVLSRLAITFACSLLVDSVALHEVQGCKGCTKITESYSAEDQPNATYTTSLPTCMQEIPDF